MTDHGVVQQAHMLHT